MSYDDPSQWLHDDPSVVSVFSDSLLVEWHREPLLEKPSFALISELWLRKWLYKAKCPAEILDAISAGRNRQSVGFSDTFQHCFDRDLLPLRPRRKRELRSESNFPDAREKEIWQLLLARVRSYLEADGLIAVVPQGLHTPKDAVSVPFQLEPGEGICGARDELLPIWVSDLEQFRRSYALGMAVRIFATFPKGRQPEGRSLGLALVLARERLSGRLPWFDPLDVLVTGVVESRSIGSVEGVPAKQNLADRLGCSLFAAPGATEAPNCLCIPIGSPIGPFLLAARAQCPQATDEASIASEILSRCRQEKRLWKAANDEIPFSRMQEMERLLSHASDALSLHSPATDEAKLAGVLLRSIRSDLAGSSSAVNDLEEIERSTFWQRRREPIYGRDWFVAEIEKFLQDRPGGLLLVTGKAGYGKTALLAHCMERQTPDAARFLHFFRVDRDNLRSTARFFHRLALFLDRLLPEDYRLGRSRADAEPLETVRHLLRNYADVPDRDRPAIHIVIDGLDEASKPYFESFFPFTKDSWPAGLHVILSARTAGAQDVSLIRTWHDQTDSQLLDLTSLPAAVIKAWVSTADFPKLKALASEPSFIALLCEKTEGCALYIEHLLLVFSRSPDLDESWRKRLNDTPTGYSNLIGDQYRAVFLHKPDGATNDQLSLFQRLVELCTIARDPLDETDLRAILGVSFIPDFKELPRWIAQSKGDTDRGSFFEFSNQLIREGLEDSGLALETAKRLLLNYCLRWREHRSPYAIRHLLWHLREAKSAEVFAVAGDDGFLAAQAELFNKDATAPLRPLQAALQAASEQNDVFQIARFSLKHAHYVSKITQETPLDALRYGGIERALPLIATYERSSDQVLWYLTLAAESLLNSDLLQVRYILEDRFPRDLASVTFRDDKVGWAVDILSWLLTSAEIANAPALVHLLAPNAQKRLWTLIAEARRSPSQVPATIQPTRDDLTKLANQLKWRAPHDRAKNWGVARVLEAAGIAVASRGNRVLAKQPFAVAKEQIATMGGKPLHRCWALINLAEAEGKAGLKNDAHTSLAEARAVASEVTEPLAFTRMLCEIAHAQARALGKRASEGTFHEALVSVEKIPQHRCHDKLEALGEVIEAQSKSRLSSAAIESLHRADKIVRELRPTQDRCWIGVAALALSLAKAAQYNNEFARVAEQYVDTSLALFVRRNKAYRLAPREQPPTELAKRIRALLAARAGNTEVALRGAARIVSRELRSTAMRDIAIVCIERKDFDGFRVALSYIADRRSEVLPDIAVELVLRGERTVFFRLLWLCAFYFDSSYRMLALLIVLFKPDLEVLNKILALVGQRPLSSKTEPTPNLS